MNKPKLFAALAFVLVMALQVFVQDEEFTAGLVIRVLVAVAAGYFIMRTGFRMLGGFARPVAPPPEPGELRKVKIIYRCSICGTEVRMTMANDQIPEPPRHCLEDMDLTAPIED